MTCFQVTLTTANTNYNLLTLVRAISTTFVDVGDMVLQADDDGGAQVFLIGDSALSSSRYGARMQAGDFSAHFPDLGDLYARCDTDAKKLNVMVIR